MRYILVHGAWQGAWCWELMAAELRMQGHTVFCLDLPGHGSHAFPLNEVTYEVYYEYLENEIKRQDQEVIIVAHSMAGLFCAPLLDKYTNHISHLFLIAAYVAQGGESLLDLAISGGPSEIPNLLITDEINRTQTLDLNKAKTALYHDCPSDLADWALSRLQPQPMGLFTHPIFWKDSGQSKHKRTYILCEDDRDVHPTTQKNVLKNYPCQTVSIKSGHFPFLSQPKQLAAIIRDPIWIKN